MKSTPARGRPTFDEVARELESRWPESRIEPSLDRITKLMAALGNPQRRLTAIHLTGTNGKTTTARMIDEILRAAGLSVGRFTSPHMENIRERITVDGSAIDEAGFVAAYLRVRSRLAEVEASSGFRLSFFEVITAMAFVAFDDAAVDAAVVEVGMGGTWDATNVLDGRVAVFTPISLDHTELLGPDEVSIAAEKAGIIKRGASVVIADQIPAVLEVLSSRATHMSAAVSLSGLDHFVASRRALPDGQLLQIQGQSEYPDLYLPLIGEHQAANAATALAASEALLTIVGRTLSAGQARRALAEVRSPGRLEAIADDPLVLVDASHNPSGMSATVGAVQEKYPSTSFIVVVAALDGKDVAGMLRALNALDPHFILTENDSPRCLPAEKLAEIARMAVDVEQLEVQRTLHDAIASASAKVATEPQKAVLITGSVVTASEARSFLRPRVYPR